MNKNNILTFFLILLVIALASYFLIILHIVSIPGISEDRIASQFLNLYNISEGEEKFIFGENVTREEIVNKGYEIIKINDTYITKIPALSRAFENEGLAMIYHEDRGSIFPLQDKVLEYNGSFYHAAIGSN